MYYEKYELLELFTSESLIAENIIKYTYIYKDIELNMFIHDLDNIITISLSYMDSILYDYTVGNVSFLKKQDNVLYVYKQNCKKLKIIFNDTPHIYMLDFYTQDEDVF